MKLATIIVIVAALLSYCNAHTIWGFYQESGTKILWNMVGYESVEKTCQKLDKPVNRVKMCSSGAAGKKCVETFIDTECKKTHMRKDIYNTGGNLCGIVDKPDTNDKDFSGPNAVLFTQKEIVRSIKTYNC